jgi:hypothetical protein
MQKERYADLFAGLASTPKAGCYWNAGDVMATMGVKTLRWPSECCKGLTAPKWRDRTGWQEFYAELEARFRTA